MRIHISTSLNTRLTMLKKKKKVSTYLLVLFDKDYFLFKKKTVCFCFSFWKMFNG